MQPKLLVFSTVVNMKYGMYMVGDLVVRYPIFQQENMK